MQAILYKWLETFEAWPAAHALKPVEKMLKPYIMIRYNFIESLLARLLHAHFSLFRTVRSIGPASWNSLRPPSFSTTLNLEIFSKER